MIKSILLFSINVYQSILSVIIKNILGVNVLCRYDETCSSYTKRSISEKGVFIGFGLGIRRILSCQPITH